MQRSDAFDRSPRLDIDAAGSVRRRQEPPSACAALSRSFLPDGPSVGDPKRNEQSFGPGRDDHRGGCRRSSDGRDAAGAPVQPHRFLTWGVHCFQPRHGRAAGWDICFAADALGFNGHN